MSHLAALTNTQVTCRLDLAGSEGRPSLHLLWISQSVLSDPPSAGWASSLMPGDYPLSATSAPSSNTFLPSVYLRACLCLTMLACVERL